MTKKDSWWATKDCSKEFNLSEKRIKIYTGEVIQGCKEWYWYYPARDVEKFIRLLNDLSDNEEFRAFEERWKHTQSTRLGRYIAWSKMKMNELAGDKLTASTGKGKEE